MSLKHLKSGQDSIESYFYKTALDKNLIDEESGISQALEQIKKNDLSVSEDLTENVLRLSSALRNRGLVNYANSLEQKLLAFKTSSNAHLYNVHGEEGKDLLDFAHPDGGPEMAQSKDHNGVVETLLEQHKLITDVVKKQPTGKVGSLELIKMVKVVLAQSKISEHSKKKVSKHIDNTKSFLIKAKQYFLDSALPQTISADTGILGNDVIRQLDFTIDKLSSFKDQYLKDGSNLLSSSILFNILKKKENQFDEMDPGTLFKDSSMYKIYRSYLSSAISEMESASWAMQHPESESPKEDNVQLDDNKIKLEKFNNKILELVKAASNLASVLPASKLDEDKKEKLNFWLTKTFTDELNNFKKIVELFPEQLDIFNRKLMISERHLNSVKSEITAAIGFN